MITSIVFRHGTDVDVDRADISKDLLKLTQYSSFITRAQVIMSKETHHTQSPNLVTCHLSVHIPRQHPVEIYEKQATANKAFHKALDRAITRIQRGHYFGNAYRAIQLSAGGVK